MDASAIPLTLLVDGSPIRMRRFCFGCPCVAGGFLLDAGFHVKAALRMAVGRFSFLPLKLLWLKGRTLGEASDSDLSIPTA